MKFFFKKKASEIPLHHQYGLYCETEDEPNQIKKKNKYLEWMIFKYVNS